MTFSGADIARATGGHLERDAGAGPVVTDTRHLPTGAWFLALTGDRFDGHDFLRAARDAGAAGCVVERAPSPEWGAMITEGARTFYDWWTAASPGIAILLVVLAFNFIGDALRDSFDVKDTGR